MRFAAVFKPTDTTRALLRSPSPGQKHKSMSSKERIRITHARKLQTSTRLISHLVALPRVSPKMPSLLEHFSSLKKSKPWGESSRNKFTRIYNLIKKIYCLQLLSYNMCTPWCHWCSLLSADVAENNTGNIGIRPCITRISQIILKWTWVPTYYNSLTYH